MCDAKRWVIVDRDVCSASESFVNFVKKTRWAKTVGTKTKGDGLGSTPILVMLPNSGLLIRFELLCPDNSSGELSTISGTIPDYVSAVKEEPYDTLKRILLSINND